MDIPKYIRLKKPYYGHEIYGEVISYKTSSSLKKIILSVKFPRSRNDEAILDWFEINIVWPGSWVEIISEQEYLVNYIIEH